MGAEDKDFLEAEWPEGERRIDLIARLLMVYASCDDDEDYLMMQWTMRPDGITAVKSAAASGVSDAVRSAATSGASAAE